MRVFNYSQDQLNQLVHDMLKRSKALGASAAVAYANEHVGLTVKVRNQQLETIEAQQSKELSITLYLGKKSGLASTSDFSSHSLDLTVQAAFDFARFTQEDEFSGLPNPDDYAKNLRDLDLYHVWDVDQSKAESFALAAEQAGLEVHKAITNSEASVYSGQGQYYLANTDGFVAGSCGSSHSIGASFIAGKGEHMQTNQWFASKSDARDLPDPASVGRYAAERTLASLYPQRLKTQSAAVLFETPLAASLIRNFLSAISGRALFTQSSFLLDSVGKTIFAPHVQLTEDPFIPKALGSKAFDAEGVSVRQREIVRDGVVQGYLLSSYSARKLGLKTTGNAGGAHNVNLFSNQTEAGDDLSVMLKKMHKGLFVTEIMGFGVNMVTGDYSHGAAGYWVENGNIVYPVHEITIAGNLKRIFQQIVAIGADIYTSGKYTCGSILIEEMRIGGTPSA